MSHADQHSGRVDTWTSNRHKSLPYSNDPNFAERHNLVDRPTFRPIPEFEGVHNVWPRGDRLAAIRVAAQNYRERFINQGTVLGVKSFDIAAARYPSQYAFQNYSGYVNPLISIINRMMAIQYKNFNGVPRTLVWEPTVTDGSKKAGFYSNLIGSGNGPKWFNKTMRGVDREVLATFPGDVEVGVGISLLWTPRHTDGNYSLCINTSDGVWISSENGVARDSWQPELSKIPGLKSNCEFYEREVVLKANTLEDSIDQYDSMIKEKEMASYSPQNPEWKQILPSSACAPWMRQWPLNPTMEHGGINYGEHKRR